MAEKPLTPKQARFVEEYLHDLNATQAAIRAGYSPGSAEVEGCRLLKNAKVSDAVAQAQAERSRQTGISQARVIQELALIAFSNLTDFVAYGADGILVMPSTAIDERAKRALAEVSQKDTKFGTNMSFKLHDKVAALKLLGQHLGMFDEKGAGATVNVNVTTAVQEIIREELRQARAAAPQSLDDVHQRFPLPPAPPH